jgi:uncharacterized protein YegP (UPF0339 family)
MATTLRAKLKRFFAGDGFRWHVQSTNNNILSGSTEGYSQETDCENCIEQTTLALIADRGDEWMRQQGWVRSEA